MPADAGITFVVVLHLSPDHESMIAQMIQKWTSMRVVQRFGPPSVLVNREHDIQHISESAGRFLQVVGGNPTTNLLRLVHPALRAALFRAAQTGEVTEASRVPMELEGKLRAVDIRVAAGNDLAPDYLVVTFDARDPSAGAGEAPLAAPAEGQPEPLIQHLERELEQVKAQCR